MNDSEMVTLWERHLFHEFVDRDADLAVSTMVEDARVMHLPTMSGGAGREQLRRYYADEFIPSIPDGARQEPVWRSIGPDSIVDEAVMFVPHIREIPFLLPGLAPTGKMIEAALVIVVRFRDELMESERLYWDQAAVLAQLGLVDAGRLPMADPLDVTSYLLRRDDRGAAGH